MKDYIEADDLKPCTVCSKYTSRIDICYEGRVCSDECLNVLDKQYEEYLRLVGDYEEE